MYLLVMTFVRVYVNNDSTAMYTRLFHTVFEVIATNLHITKVTWQHLHNSGIRCIVMDMDSKQMSGKFFHA